MKCYPLPFEIVAIQLQPSIYIYTHPPARGKPATTWAALLDGMLRIPTNWMSYSYMVGTAWMFGDSVVWMVFWNLWIMAPSFFPWSTLWKAMRFYIGTPERSTSRLSHANPRCIWWQWRHKQRLFSTSSWKVHQANSVGMVKASQRSQLHGCSRTVTTRRRKDLPRQC